MFNNLSDKEIADGLFKGRNLLISWYFKEYKVIFTNVIKKVCNYPVKYEEFVNDFYVYLVTPSKAKEGEKKEDKKAPIQHFSGTGSLKYFLAITAKNFLLRNKENFIEDKSKEEFVIPDEPEASSATDKITAKLDAHALLKELAKEHPNYAKVLVLLFLREMTPEEVAKEMGTTVSNVYNLKSRGLSSLRDRYDR